ncbi:MAG: hypothetical protein MUF53_07995 [Gemmatimonadaceae bacterium]|nr:hypothetical protein [Gemmatimonadaceae bacterium]
MSRFTLPLSVLLAVGPGLLAAQAPPTPATPPTDPLASPMVDTLAPLLVFPPANQRWYTAASRNGRLLLDVGRTDAETKKRTDRIPVIAALAASRGTVRPGDTFLLRGTWGRELVRVTGFDVWNGRIVATVQASAAADSAAKAKAPAVASAWRLRSGEAEPVDSIAPMAVCARDSLATALTPRIARVRDSLVTVVRALVPRITVYQQARRPKPALLRTTHAAGCGDTPWVVVIASLRGENTEWVAERAVLLGPDGAARGVKLDDLRFEGHEALRAFDADGDGRDDLATRAVAEASGGTSILRWDPRTKRFTRLTAGFQWEYR